MKKVSKKDPVCLTMAQHRFKKENNMGIDSHRQQLKIVFKGTVKLYKNPCKHGKYKGSLDIVCYFVIFELFADEGTKTDKRNSIINAIGLDQTNLSIFKMS